MVLFKKEPRDYLYDTLVRNLGGASRSNWAWNPQAQSPSLRVAQAAPRTPTMAAIRKIGPGSTLSVVKPGTGISASEMAEIDKAKIAARFTRPDGLLGPDARYARDAGTVMAIYGEQAPPPALVARRLVTSGFAPTRENISGVYVPEPEEDSMGNLSNILGGITDIAKTASDLAGLYYKIKPPTFRIPPPTLPSPPAVSPAAKPGFEAPAAVVQRAAAISKPPDVSPSTATVFDTSGFKLPSWLTPGAGRSLVAGTGTSLVRTSGMAGLGKIAAIAAALGIGVEVVSAVLDVDKANRRRRRRRMLTKSDQSDIAVMAALLGKGSEAFRTWLAANALHRH